MPRLPSPSCASSPCGCRSFCSDFSSVCAFYLTQLRSSLRRRRQHIHRPSLVELEKRERARRREQRNRRLCNAFPASLSLSIVRPQADRPLWKKLSKEEPRALNSWGHWSNLYTRSAFWALSAPITASLLFSFCYLGPRHLCVESAGCGCCVCTDAEGASALCRVRGN